MRQRILQGLSAEITERGIRFTMDDLARRLGMSKRTLYEHFSSKEELVGFLLASFAEEIKQKREAIAQDPALDLREKVKRMLAVRASLCADNTDHLAIDIKKSMPEQWRQLECAMDELWQRIDELIHEGVRTGCFRPVFVPAIRTLFKGAFNEIANYPFLLRHKVTISEMMDHILDILMFGIIENDKNSHNTDNCR